VDDIPEGVDVKQRASFKPFPDCWFVTLPATFGAYLPEALAKGAYKVAPKPLVVGTKGLDGIQEAVDLQRVITEKGQEGIKEAMGRVGRMEGDRVSPVKLVVERE
jgi:hypothetical protein